MSARYKYGMNWIRQEKRLSIYMRDNFACLYCGKGIEEEIIMTLDHVEHRGGNHASNLVTTCMECNMAKGSRSIEDFLLELTEDDNVRAARLLARVQRAVETDLGRFLPEAKEVIKRRKEAALQPF